MRHLRSVPAMRPPGSPRRGDLAGSNTSEPRGSAPRERDHRGGDHPVPSRTRQLSPPSPRVLQREAAGGQGVALAEGAFLYAPREARGGTAPCGPFARLGGNEPNGPRRSLRVLYFQLRGCLDSRIGVATYVTLCKELRNMRGYGFDRASFACGVFDAFKLLSRCMRSVKSALV